MGPIARALALVIGWCLTVVGGLMFAFTAAGLSPATQSDFGMELFLVGFFLLVGVAGALLVNVARPGFWVSAIRRIAAVLASRSTLFNPLAHTFLFYLLGVVLVLLVPREPVLPVFAVISAFAIVNPALIAARPHWWVNAVISVPCALLLLALLPATAEGVAGKRLGESTMVLLAPVMFYPVALALSGIGRLLIVRKRAGTPVAPVSAR